MAVIATESYEQFAENLQREIEADKGTPLGPYNPDWALLLKKDGVQRLYFVVETKSSLFTDDLRDKESAKIECGKAHFRSLTVGENPARYAVARSLNDVLTEAMKA